MTSLVYPALINDDVQQQWSESDNEVWIEGKPCQEEDLLISVSDAKLVDDLSMGTAMEVQIFFLDQDKSSAFSCFNFLALPLEIQFLITLKMSLRDALALSTCSKHLYALITDPLYWRLRARGEWRSLKRSRLMRNIDWSAYYKFKHCLHRGVTIEPIRIDGCPNGLYGFTGSAFEGKIYFIGGQQASSVRVSDINVYDTQLNTFSKFKLRSGQVPVFARHVSAIKDGIIYVFGGYNGIDTFYDFARFNIAAGTWEYPPTTIDPGATRPPLRSNGACAIIGNKFYVFGGSNNDESGQYQIVEDFSVLDLDTMHWTTLLNSQGVCRVNGDKPRGRVGHRMVACGNKLYVFGGGMWVTGLGWTQRFRGLGVYDVEKNEWSHIPAPTDMQDVSYPFMFTVHSQIFITQLAEKRVHVFDTLTSEWSEIEITGEQPSENRTMGANAVVGDNCVYFLGAFHLNQFVQPKYCDFHRMILGQKKQAV